MALYPVYLGAVTSNTGGSANWFAVGTIPEGNSLESVFAAIGRKEASPVTSIFAKSQPGENKALVKATLEALPAKLLEEIAAGIQVISVKLYASLRSESKGKTTKFGFAGLGTHAEPEVTSGGAVWYQAGLTQAESEALTLSELEHLVVELEHTGAINTKCYEMYVAIETFSSAEEGGEETPEEEAESGIQKEKHYKPIPAGSAIIGTDVSTTKAFPSFRSALERAIAQGLDSFRWQISWNVVEAWKAKSGSTWGGGALSFPGTQAENLALVAAANKTPVIVAGFGPPTKKILELEVLEAVLVKEVSLESELEPLAKRLKEENEAGKVKACQVLVKATKKTYTWKGTYTNVIATDWKLEVGGCTIKVKVRGSGTISQLHVTAPYGVDFVKKISVNSGDTEKIAQKENTYGTLVINFATSGAEEEGTITLAGALKPNVNKLAEGEGELLVGTRLKVERLAYPALEFDQPSGFEQGVEAYVRYVEYLAEQIVAAGCAKGYICIWNEPPWGGDLWDSVYRMYETEAIMPASLVSGSEGHPISYLRPLVRALRAVKLPPGIKLINGATDKSGIASIYVSGTRPGDTVPSTIAETMPYEGNHPYDYQPDGGIWDKEAGYKQINPENPFNTHQMAQAQAEAGTGVGIYITESSQGVETKSDELRARFIARHILAWWGEAVPLMCGTATVEPALYPQEYATGKRIIDLRNSLGVAGGSSSYAPAFVSVAKRAAKTGLKVLASTQICTLSGHELSLGECFTLTSLSPSGTELIPSESGVLKLYYVSQVIDANNFKLLPCGDSNGFLVAKDLTAGTLTPRAWPLLSSAIYAKKGGIRFIWQRTVGANKPTKGPVASALPSPPTYGVVVSGIVTSAINMRTGAAVTRTAVASGTEVQVAEDPIALISSGQDEAPQLTKPPKQENDKGAAIPTLVVTSANGATAYFLEAEGGGANPITGLSINGNGEIIGTPTAAAATYKVQVKAENAIGPTIVPFEWKIVTKLTAEAPPSQTNSEAVPLSPGIQLGKVKAATGVAPFTYTIASGFPPGISLTSGGEAFGTPTEEGVFTCKIQAKDAQGVTDLTINFTWTILASAAPIVATNAATNVRSSEARLNGEVNPEGFAANGHFEWGLSIAYGNSTPEQAEGSGTSPVPLSALLTGLTSGTTYHFRAVAKRGSLVIHGADRTFTTENVFVPLPARVRLREHPPLQLCVSARSPAGVTTRWAEDDPDPKNVPKGMTFGTVMPGGFDRLSLGLQRDPAAAYPDLAVLSQLSVLGVGGSIAWQGRLEKVPDSSGYQEQASPEAVGYQSHLEDDQTAREIYVDVDQSKWGPLPTSQKLAFLDAGSDYEDATTGEGALNPGDPSVSPSITCQLSGPWERQRICRAYYDADGIPLAYIYTSWLPGPTVSGSGYAVQVQLSGGGSDDLDEYNLATYPGGAQGTRVATLANRTFVEIGMYANFGANAENKVYPVFFTIAALYGRHGLLGYGPIDATHAPGLLASDIEGHAVGRWAPLLKYTTGDSGTIQPSTFVIPQLTFTDPTTVAEIIKQATRFELRDWAVWEGPTYYSNDRGARGKKWKARVGPAQLQEAGAQASRLWNGVVVQYQDVSGQQQIVGPPGVTGGRAEAESASLLDSDPENPLNKVPVGAVPIRKWAMLRMGIGTVAGAIQVGQKFLEESRRYEASGQASINGVVQDSSGVFWPAWAIRAGDEISFVDASEPGYRRIVSTSYDDSTRTNTLQLDQPPDGLQALLERLSVVLVPLGIS